MKAVVSGFSSLTPEFFCLLEEPVPFELSTNLKNKLIFGESAHDMRIFLRQLRELLPENDFSSRRLFEAINQAPKSRTTLTNQDCDIHLQIDEDVVSKLTGIEFESYQNRFEVNAVRGDSRQELFDRGFSRLLKSASSICIVDRYFGSIFSTDGYKHSGSYWALERILDLDVPLVKVLTSSAEVSYTKIEERLGELHSSSRGLTRLEIFFGRPVHNRHLTFNFTGSATPYSIIVDKGLEVFQYERLREGPGISQMSPITASTNEAQILNSHSKLIKIERFNKKPA
jgi:hypothetical protein